MESQQATSEGGNGTPTSTQSPEQQQQQQLTAAGIPSSEGLQVVTPQGMQTLQPLAPVSFGDGPPVAMPMMQVPLMPHLQQGQLVQVSGQEGQQQAAQVVASMATVSRATQPYMTVAQGTPLISQAQVPLPQSVQMVGGVPMMVGIQQPETQVATQGSPHIISQDSRGQVVAANSTPSPAPQGSAESQPATPGSIGSPAPQMQMADGTIVTAPTAAMQVPLIQYQHNMMGQAVQGQLPSGYIQAPAQLQAQVPVQQQHQQQPAAPKTEQDMAIKNLKPPKKPLTPYMRFSKSVSGDCLASWSQYAHLSVCMICAATNTSKRMCLWCAISFILYVRFSLSDLAASQSHTPEPLSVRDWSNYRQDVART